MEGARYPNFQMIYALHLFKVSTSPFNNAFGPSNEDLLGYGEAQTKRLFFAHLYGLPV